MVRVQVIDGQSSPNVNAFGRSGVESRLVTHASSSAWSDASPVRPSQGTTNAFNLLNGYSFIRRTELHAFATRQAVNADARDRDGEWKADTCHDTVACTSPPAGASRCSQAVETARARSLASIQCCSPDTSEPAPTDRATALDADQMNTSVATMPSNIMVGVVGVPGVDCGRGMANTAPASSATTLTSSASGRARLPIHRNGTRAPRPPRTAANRPPNSGACTMNPTNPSRLMNFTPFAA